MKTNRIKAWYQRWLIKGRYAELMQMLENLDNAEMRETAALCDRDDWMGSERRLRRILGIRDEQAWVMRQLGWHGQARTLERDTAMRREYSREPFTPLADPTSPAFVQIEPGQARFIGDAGEGS